MGGWVVGGWVGWVGWVRAVSSREGSAPARTRAATMSADPFCAAMKSGLQEPCGWVGMGRWVGRVARRLL